MQKHSAVNVLLTTCTNTKKDEKILFVSDDTSQQVANIMWQSTEEYPNRVLVRMTDRKMHGSEPPAATAAAMAEADVIFGITKFSMFHTAARRNAVSNGARFVNMVDYSEEMMYDGGLFGDFEAQGAWMDRVAEAFKGDTIRVTSATGMDVTASIKGREAVRQYGRSLKAGTSSSPPNLEFAWAPVEETANGVAVIDGSIPFPGLGLLSESIRLTIKDGAIVDIEGGALAAYLKKSMAALNDEAVYQMAEIGVGFNNRSVLCGRMLEDEGAMGTMHFGWGNNLAFGGHIESSNHLDMVCKDPSIWVDGRQIMKYGEFLLK